MTIYYETGCKSAAEKLAEVSKADMFEIDICSSERLQEDHTAILFLPYRSIQEGIKGYHSDFFHKNSHIERWIVIFSGVSGAYGAGLMKWKQFAGGFNKSIDIIAAETDEEALEKAVSSLKKNLKKCIVGFTGNEELAKQFAEFLKYVIPDWEFECVQDEQLSDEFETSCKLILYGRDIRDFYFKRVEIDNKNKDLLIVYDCEFAVLREYRFALSDEIENMLNDREWTISDLFNNYVYCNSKYELEKERRKKGIMTDIDTYWDEYGLPYRNYELNEDQRKEFFERFNAADIIKKWLNNESVI